MQLVVLAAAWFVWLALTCLGLYCRYHQTEILETARLVAPAEDGLTLGKLLFMLGGAGFVGITALAIGPHKLIMQTVEEGLSTGLHTRQERQKLTDAIRAFKEKKGLS